MCAMKQNKLGWESALRIDLTQGKLKHSKLQLAMSDQGQAVRLRYET
jgi:hypothetical protein